MSFVWSLVEFEKCCEFSVMRWTHDSCTKINKSPPVSNGIRASSFEIWTENLAQSLTMGTLTNSWSFIFGDSNWKFCSRLPRRHPKTGHSDAQKIKTCWYTRTLYLQTGKIQCELKLLFGVYYWFFNLWTGIIWPLRMGFCSERAAAELGPRGLSIEAMT